MKNETVNNAPPPIPGNMAYIIAKEVSAKGFPRFIDTAFTDFLWCIRARSNDTFRPAITGILIEPAKIVATDGHRLHIIVNPYPSIPPGKYEVYQVNQSKVILIAKPATTKENSYPAWNIPAITMEGIKPKHEITIYQPIDFYIEILKRRICDIKLLEGAISNEPMNVRIYGEDQPIIIATKTRTAIVMPLIDRKVS
jgi:hypothetical protein